MTRHPRNHAIAPLLDISPISRLNAHRIMNPKRLLALCLAAISFTLHAAEVGHTFAIGTNDFLLDNQRFQIRCGEIHAARVPREYWENRLRMAKAMGLNTVCAYLFWNMQEPLPGQFNWSGQADIAEFCRIAQKVGLWVVLRPGPYACAEWEMGGLPWWLLKNDEVKLRTRDPLYLDPAKTYLKEVGRVLGPLQITHGGPIIMVQVENEYGSFGRDTEYMGDLRQTMLDAGFDVPLFACNPAGDLSHGYRADLFPVVNFGSDPARGFAALRRILPQGPLMCGEFYPGWFDTWGAPHHLGNTPKYLSDLEYMLKAGASFSIYMAHGGTTFGLWSGADHPFKPDTSTYDYDAPISEAGWPTPKFFQTRELFSKYLLPGETLSEPPPTNAVISIAPTLAAECAMVFDNLPAPKSDLHPRPMEDYDQGFGSILYRATLPAGPAAILEAAGVHDYGFIYLDSQCVGFMDRRSRNFKVRLPARKNPTTLNLLVEAVGRVNFGIEIHDHKGLVGDVTVNTGETTNILTNWQVFNLPLDSNMLSHLQYASANTNGPAFWRANVDVPQPGDTFLDMRSWGKGVVWVNGHCLGRFWNIGPDQTLYVPGPWLKAGKNEVVIYNLLGPAKPEVAGLAQPILDQLCPELDFMAAHRPDVTLQLDAAPPVQASEFKPGPEPQEVHFAKPAAGRYFCLEALSSLNGKPYAAVAELSLLDESGKALDQNGWIVAYVDSEEREREDGSAENAIDGQTTSFWHTQWGSASPPYPHRLVLDFGQSLTVAGIRYTPRQGDDSTAGRIKDYRLYVGDNLIRK
jgi:beta-galactosidase